MPTFRKTIFWLHLICGVAAGLVVFIMSATGVILTYEKQLARWADGFEVRPPSPDSRRLGPTELLRRAGAHGERVPTVILFRADPGQPARISFGRESVEVDPYTGQAMGEGAPGVRSFFRQMIVWHRWLGQSGDGRAVGKAITGACNLAFLFIVLSGAYLWWPAAWNWNRLRPIVLFRGGLRGKARDFNWHNVFGFWNAIPLAVVVATATFFSYSWTTDMLYALTGEERPRGGQPSGQGRPAGEETQEPGFGNLDELFEKAAALEPDWTTISIRLSQDADVPVAFALDRGNGFRPDLRSTVALDRATGAVVERRGYSDNLVAQNARTWIRWLHTGEAGGLIGQTIAGVASLAACFLVYTGWMLSWRRFQGWRGRR